MLTKVFIGHFIYVNKLIATCTKTLGRTCKGKAHLLVQLLSAMMDMCTLERA